MDTDDYKWADNYTVRSYEVHNDGRVNMPAICNYLQETAGNHAAKLGWSIEQMESKNWTWFLSRLKVEMQDYPIWRDQIIVKTWPAQYDKIITERDFQIFNDDEELIGTAISSWVVIDLNTRRPIRIPDGIKNLITNERDRSMNTDMRSKMDSPGQIHFQRSFSVRYMDLDVNKHVNNVHYIEWAMEALPEEILTNKKMASLDIIFRSECLYGDTVNSIAGQSGDHVYHHRLLRDSDHKELALVETKWTDRDH